MGSIKPFTEADDWYAMLESGGAFFDPSNNRHTKVNKTMVCCCGYELIKESETTYRCTGGSHRYNLAEGDVIKDKTGKLLFRVPGDK